MRRLFHGTTEKALTRIRATRTLAGPVFLSPQRDVAESYGVVVVVVDVDDDELLIDLDLPGARLLSTDEANDYLGEERTLDDYLDEGFSVGVTGSVTLRRTQPDDNPPYSGYQPQWYTKPRPGSDRVCYPTKTKALLVFMDHNWQVIEEWGGPGRVDDPTAFESINEEHELRGRRRVDSLAKALWWSMPAGRPFCLENMKLELLNQTDPATHSFSERGMVFTLPDYVEEAELAKREADYYAELMDDDPAALFSGLPEVPF